MVAIQRRAVDEVMDILQDEHRRYVLYRLSEERYTNIDELAQQVAAWRHDAPRSQLSAETIDRTALLLHHVHLPALAEYGILEFDPRSGDVVRVAELEELNPVLDAVQGLEEELTTPRVDSASYS